MATDIMDQRSENLRPQAVSSQLIAVDVLQSTFRGVVVATKASSLEGEFNAWLARRAKPTSSIPEAAREDVASPVATEPMDVWLDAVASEMDNSDLYELTALAIAIASMRTSVREQTTISSEQLGAIWTLISKAIAALGHSTLATFTVSRSAQGFLAIPLCSLLVEGRIDELWRFHFWMPDGQRPNLSQGWGIHSHQAFAQSWILAGKGEDVQYQSATVSSREEASHAVFSLAWTDASGSGSTYKTHQTQSTVANTGAYVRVKETQRATHGLDSTYTIPAATFHSTTVDPDSIHATLFVFDGKGGFVQDAPVLGPADQESSTQIRAAAGTTAAEISQTTTDFRLVESICAVAQKHFLSSKLEEALQFYERALHVCRERLGLVSARHQLQIRASIAGIYRRFGRYETALDILQELLRDTEQMGHEYMGIAGEMSVIYRHMNNYDQAKAMAQAQYDTAKDLGDIKHITHAAGTLGILNYQMYLQNKDPELLDTAIIQLEERIDLARKLCEDATERQSTLTRLIIGLGRLANCRLLRGEAAAAVELTREALALSKELFDSTLIALSHLFHGRALAKDGQTQRAMEHFQASEGCPPVVALCREPSEEHLDYLSELNDFEVDFDCVDEHGYSALDYTEFNSNELMGNVVIKALRRSLRDHVDTDGEIARRRRESQLRKGYREIFQEELRPVLTKNTTAELSLHDLRHAYTTAVRKNEERKKMFDRLKYMCYKDFLAFGRVPKSGDNIPGTSTPLVRTFRETTTGCDEDEEVEFLVFFSYRWLNTDQKTRATPDDEKNTLFNRMKDALSILLEQHPHLNENRVGIWLVSSHVAAVSLWASRRLSRELTSYLFQDHVCVDQADPIPGISALPMIITQCNALISLVDDAYHKRAWCTVEVMIASALRKAYRLHVSYEYHSGSSSESGHGTLVAGSDQSSANMQDKELTFEADRPTVMFLARQSKFLG